MVYTQLERESALMDSLPSDEPFNEAGYRSIRSGELEFKSEELYELREKDGQTIVYLKEIDRSVKCECDCDNGDCVVTGGGAPSIANQKPMHIVLWFLMEILVMVVNGLGQIIKLRKVGQWRILILMISDRQIFLKIPIWY